MKLLHSLLAITLLATAAHAATPKDELAFREQMGLQHYRSVSYRDAKGAPIGFAELYSSVRDGKQLSIVKDPQKSVAVVSIVDEPSAAPSRFLLHRGERLPVESLRKLDGGEISFQSRNGRALLINFFFAECAPCIQETPALNAFAKRRRDIDVVAITFDEPATAREFAAHRGFTWPIVPSAEDLLEEIGVRTFPAFAYLGRDGKVLGIDQSAAIAQGELTPASLEAWIRKLESK